MNLTFRRAGLSRTAPAFSVAFVRGFPRLHTQNVSLCFRKTGANAAGTVLCTHLASRSAVISKAVSGGNNSHAGHAFLHDFCMAIPYGALAVVGALALLAFGQKQTAIFVAIGGIVVIASAALSLKQWKDHKQSTPFTLLSAGTSASVAYTCWTAFQEGVVPWLTGLLLALSGALALFCAYNVAAGGNPPKRKET